ncbi:BMP family ABC transporter substrate-binding protein [Acetomicrobium sp. UBA5826]|uniref:BMP family ABC transporter substrate-binding protein n=1 Tax=Acetomicrobium sp. UBA5826 TaxID=1946039 RepID=UPI0025802C31|nr:BMP family ABC transporter substrate-binding protein [Acetomicrobium sp. UBA5826]
MRKMALIVALLTLCLFSTAAMSFEAVPADKLKAAWLYNGPIGDGGWTYMHDLGRLEVEKAFPAVTTMYVESVPEGPDSVRAMENFIRNGAKVIFATSFGYMDYVQEAAKRHPDVIFMHCSGFKMADNVGIYFGRMYQARYLSGLVAGSMTKKNVIGFVAAHPIPEVIRGLNAFTLGARRANPDVKVKVVWLFSWIDPGKEKEAAKALVDAGADVLAMHANTGSVPQAAEEAGVYVVGYNNDMSQYAPTKHLTAPVWNWGVVYKYTVEKVINGTWEPEDIWWGLDKGMVALAPYAKDVPDAVKDLVEGERQRIASGEWDVFEGPIKDNKGNLIVKEGQKLTDQDLLSMNWLVEGVEGELPK